MNLTQLLIFELGTGCNLRAYHRKCPSSLGLTRYELLDTSRKLDNETIIDVATRAYREHGFTGMVGWHYYNEPTLQLERMLNLMRTIKDRVPQSQFILWTNGTVKLSTDEEELFEEIHTSDYKDDPDGDELDDRMLRRIPLGFIPCMRPFVEFILDAFGNHHPCCFDWRGEASLGNVFEVGFDELIKRWRQLREDVCLAEMSEHAPTGCINCGHRRFGIQHLDEATAQRALQWRKTKLMETLKNA